MVNVMMRNIESSLTSIQLTEKQIQLQELSFTLLLNIIDEKAQDKFKLFKDTSILPCIQNFLDSECYSRNIPFIETAACFLLMISDDLKFHEELHP